MPEPGRARCCRSWRRTHRSVWWSAAHVAASDNPLAAWLGTWLIFGGAAQLAVLDVLAQEPGWVTAAVVGLLVNLRLAAYATAMVPQWRSASLHAGSAPR